MNGNKDVRKIDGIEPSRLHFKFFSCYTNTRLRCRGEGLIRDNEIALSIASFETKEMSVKLSIVFR